MEAYTSFWQNPELEKVDAQVVSISRGGPRWSVPFPYRRLGALAPCDEAWNADDEEGYEAAYLDQLERLGAGSILADVGRLAGNGPALLVCWERPEPGAFCHRWLLARFLERETGVRIAELRPGDLPQRRNVAETRLFG